MNEKKWMIVSDAVVIAGMIYLCITAPFTVSKIIYGVCAVVFILHLLMNYSKESVQSVRTSKRYIYLIVFGVLGTMIGSYFENRFAEVEANRPIGEDSILAIYEEAYPEHDEIIGIYYTYVPGARYEVLTSGENQWSVTFLDNEEVVCRYDGEGAINLYNDNFEEQYSSDYEYLENEGIRLINQIDQELYCYKVIIHEQEEEDDQYTYSCSFEQDDLGSVDAIYTEEFYTNLFYSMFSEENELLDIYVSEVPTEVQAIVLYKNKYSLYAGITDFYSLSLQSWFADADMNLCDETALTLTDDDSIECIFEKTDGTKQKLVITLDGTSSYYEDLEEK